MIHLMVGLPASGKSTWLSQNLPEGAVIICPDQIRQEHFGITYDPKLEPQVWQVVTEQLNQLIQDGKEVFVDSTNLTKKRRKLMVDVAKRQGVPICVYVLMTPYPVCVQRNRERGLKVPEDMLRNMYRGLQFPTKREGFAQIYMINYPSPN